MTLLVTGGTGFVMSVVARRWLERDPAARAVILDRHPPDAAAARFFAPVQERLAAVVADVATPGWEAALAGHAITHVAHGATLTPLPRPGMIGNPEAEQAADVLEVNLMGTVRLLEWARRNPALRRFLYVSSGAVYRNAGPDAAGEPLPEDGYVMPVGLYGISKMAAEQVVSRYGDLFGLSVVSVRFPSVFGPMDRVTPTRNHPHIPNKVAHLALAGKPIRVTSLDAVGDYLHSADAAEAVALLLLADRLRHRVYNVASGVAVTTRELVDWTAEVVPGTRAEIVAAAEADIAQDPSLTGGKWGAYEISRIFSDTGWRPRPVREAMHDYIDWIRRNE